MESKKNILWFVITVYVAIIYSTLTVMRPMLTFLYKTLGRDALGYAIDGLLVIVALAFFVFILKIGNIGYARLVLVLLSLLVGTAVAMSFDIPEERLHFLEYGILGYLVLKAARDWRMPFLSSFVLVSFVGGGDEAIQWFLPNRVGDMRDVFMNSFGGLLGVSVGRLWNVRFKEKIFCLFFIIPLFFFTTQSLAGPHLSVIFLDVGEGDAIYIETPTSERILVDTGNPATAHRVVDFMKNKGVEVLDAVFITHPHPDHMGGIFQVLSRFEVKAIYDNGQPIPEDTGGDIYRWYKETSRKDYYKPASAGDVFKYGGVRVEVLWPKDLKSQDWNANSLVLRVSYGDVALLLMGDANAVVEEVLLNEKADLKAQVLKVGHHGSIDATSRNFLEAVSPGYAIISVNNDNIRGYPDPEVLKRLENKGIETFLTFSYGSVVFTINRQGVLNGS